MAERLRLVTRQIGSNWLVLVVVFAVLGTLAFAVAANARTATELRRQNGNIIRISAEIRCAAAAAHRAEQILLVELARRQARDSGRSFNDEGLEFTVLPPNCDPLGRITSPDRSGADGRRNPEGPGGTMPSGVSPRPPPSPRPSPSPTSTCILPPILCSPIPTP